MSYATSPCRCSDGLGASSGGCPDYLRDLSKMLQDNKAASTASSELLGFLGATMTGTVILSPIGVPLVAAAGLIKLLTSNCNAVEAIEDYAKILRIEATLVSLVLGALSVPMIASIVGAPPGIATGTGALVMGAIGAVCDSIVTKKPPSAGLLSSLALAMAPAVGVNLDEGTKRTITEVANSEAAQEAMKSPEVKKEASKTRKARYKAMSVPEKIAYQKKVIKVSEDLKKFHPYMATVYDNEIRIAKKEIENLEKPDAKAAEKKRKEELAKGIESATARGKAAGSTQAIKDQAAKEAQAYAAALKSKKSASVALPLAAAGAGFLALGPVGAAAGAGAGLIFSALSRSKKSSK